MSETGQSPTPPRPKRHHRVRHWLLGILLTPLLLVVLAVGSLYIPGVLNLIASKALPRVEEASGMKISVANISLKWPLRLALKDAIVIQRGDTMITARRLQVNVNPWAILGGRLNVSNATLRQAFYQMGAPDSLYLAARVDSLGASASMNLTFTDIKVKHADLNGASVRLILGPDSTETPKDTTATRPMTIAARWLKLRNVDFEMYMAATNDTIAATIGEADLTRGKLYIADTLDIKTDLVTLALTNGLYGKRGAERLPGLDLNRLQLEHGRARVDSFAMHGTALEVPLRLLELTTDFGLNLQASGLFAMDETQLRANNFDIAANDSRLHLNALMGLDTVPANAPVELSTNGSILLADVGLALPTLLPVLKVLPTSACASLTINASGSMAALQVDTLRAEVPGIFRLNGTASASNFTDISRLEATADLSGTLSNPAPVNSLLGKNSAVKVPPLALRATAHARGDSYNAKLTATTSGGRLALNGALSGKAPAYKATLALDSFPVRAFMSSLGIGTVDGSLTADGRGFNPLAPGAQLHAKAAINSLQLNGRRLSGLTLTAALDTGLLQADLHSVMAPARLQMAVRSRLNPNYVGWNLNGNIEHLDLQTLGLTDSIIGGKLRLDSRGFMGLHADTLRAEVILRNVDIQLGSNALLTDSLSLDFDSGTEFTHLLVGNRNMELKANATAGYKALTEEFAATGRAAGQMIEAQNIKVDSLVSLLPPFTLDFRADANSLLNSYLQPQAVSFNSLRLHAAKDSIITANARVLNLQSGESLTLDTITARLLQYGPSLLLDVNLDNRPGTMDEFAHVNLRGGVQGNRGTFRLKQRNLANETGYSIGFGLSMADSVATLNFTPLNPVIAYKEWSINSGNYLSFNLRNHQILANLNAEGAGSKIKLYSAARVATDSLSTTNAGNELTLEVDEIKLQDWLKINPFAPPLGGTASAYLKLRGSETALSGLGTLSLEDMTYGKQRVGNFDLDLDVSTTRTGVITAEATLDVDGKPAMELSGAVNDTVNAEPLLLDLKLTELPLAAANPFLPKDYARLQGTLNGRMEVTGTLKEPRATGAIRFSDAAVKVGMIGSSFRFDTTAVTVVDNLVRFNDFDIYGSNNNSLKVDGTVDLSNLAQPNIGLLLTAENMQVVDSKKGKNVNVYGRAFIDLYATVSGSLQMLHTDARLNILPQTNVTYVMTSAGASTIGLQNDDDMVRFVNFNDTAQTVKADSIAPPSSLIWLNALLTLEQGSTVTVDLSTDGKNRAQVKAEGTLDFSMNPTQPDGRLTGRLNINSGFFRYSLPVISEKNFSFVNGSYVAFNGALMNPTLNINAVDEVKANVTRAGENSRLVVFDVGLGVTGTLERLNVAFDLSTNDDITVENELKSMSATQRANQAMNLLLYGVYSGDGTTGDANLSGNALYGFLTSQLNSWAANTIKGVDLSFGMDQYDRTRNGSTNTATQYSYKVSKSLFNDRFKIVVGGNYSTDASADENLEQNLISDISFEYLLNDAGSMYIRLFRHTGYESILEGEITQTGVGFVLRRKVRRLGDIFKFKPGKK